MKKILQHILIGVGFGSSTYLVILLINAAIYHIDVLYLPRKNILAVLIMSAFIGLLSMIFDSDRLPFLAEFIIHLIGTAALFWTTGELTNCFHTSMNSSVLWFYFLLTYVIIWGIIRFNQEKQVSAINEALKKRQQK
ncbi:DUF3021 domain-containing protein [Fructobacillus sp. CRL 2054]|uniref:DUF3021 domain-containing protein n=1 Tax=Fructobacillus sp. CRL 2054 TaxID=2763007 RepID=UPI0023782287|nr:DUF3021 domain-containing protein [Fructobacillus sp. CRL 2054]MDD9138519.1 DUF3021 domain-containing protein [Fructobacillus sp. CRL 2054]